jgi:hypothetical protein
MVTKRSSESSLVRRARLAGIVVAASAMAAVTALVQACRGGASATPRGSPEGSDVRASQGNEPPVTIVIQPPPSPSSASKPLRLGLSSDLPAAPPGKPSTEPPRRGSPDDSGVIYE